jgi:uncharacterized membrane protein YedE/YeeE
VRVLLSSFGAGALFGVGLLLSGMTQPQKVFDFLNLTGAWDPSLALVMGGALLIYVVGFRAVSSWESPLLESTFSLPERTGINRELLLGAVLFGAGWALSGFCPGPALVALGGAMDQALTFVPAMVAGMLLHKFTLGRASTTPAGDDA